MDFGALVDAIGDEKALAIGGLVIGMGFGAAAQQSRFCLRSAVIEVTQRKLGEKVAVWALAFSSAVALTQLLIWLDLLQVSQARQLAARGSMSGAIIGGLMFGCGMILARGCASRLLVLSGTGNLRALVSGLILTIVSQASLRGVLSPVREALGSLWMIDGGENRSLLTLLHGDSQLGLALGVTWLAIGIWIAWRNRVGLVRAGGAVVVGVMVAAGWQLTYALSQLAFTAVALKSISFTGPSADTLMALINSPTVPLGFDIGLVPGVFIGSLAAATLTGELKIQEYSGGTSMARYFAGATLMGFGGMLAGGCAVGAGVTGGAIFAITAWTALLAMWFSAAATTMALSEG